MTITKNSSMLERLTLVTPELSFNTIDQAHDYLSQREITPRIYEGRQLSVSIDDGKAFLNISNNGQASSFPIRDSGMEGLLQKAGMGMGNFPMKIADDHLIEYNLNYLFQNMIAMNDLTVIFDKNDGENTYGIKSVMSDSYQHIDHLKVLNIVKNLDIEHEVHRLQLNRNFFRISLTNPANKIEAKIGDISSVGVDLMNSENGHASLWLGQFVYRYWCTNGASHVDDSTSIRSRAIHRGNTINKAVEDFSKSAKWYLMNGAKELEANFKILSETEVTETTDETTK